MASNSIFSSVSFGPLDPILGIETNYKLDTSPQKVNLGIGAYRTEEGKPYVFKVVRRVQQELLSAGADKEYLPIDGILELKKASQRIVFGKNCSHIDNNTIASLQSLSGTGSLRVIAEFIKIFLSTSGTVLVSDPTWPIHHNIFKSVGFDVQTYRYWDPLKLNISIDDLLSDIRNAPEHSVVVLHTCAHNPTGMDPTEKDWEEILKVIQQRNHLPIFDTAYQGFATGDLDVDAKPIRLFMDNGLEFFVAQSFAKNMGLYNDRIGVAHVMCKDQRGAQAVLSQMKPIARRIYSTPPGWGGKIVDKILNNEENFAEWLSELKEISGRLTRVRSDLKAGLITRGVPGSWDHLTRQIGMFSYTGFSPEQCDRLTNKWHIYLLKTGRISLSGLNRQNLEYVINAFDDCVRN